MKIELEELEKIIRELDAILRETPYRISLVKASYITEDNSNLWQTAEILKENDELVNIIWMSKRPFEFGIAVYKSFSQ